MSSNQSIDRPILGISLMILAMMVIPSLDVFAKILSDEFHVLQITWARFLFNIIWLLPLLVFSSEPVFRMPRRPGIHLLRSLFLVLSTLFFFLGIQSNPIPNVLSLLFVAPLVVVLLSPWVLGETFSPSRLLASSVGFVGVLIILQPGGSGFEPTLLFGLAAGFCYASYLLSTRKLSTSSGPLMTLLYTGIFGTVVLLPFLPLVWITPTTGDWLQMSAMGFFAAAGHFFIIWACRFADASLISPFNYTEIIGATLLSYLVFNTLPSTNTWLGTAVICGSGIYISVREYWHRKQSVKAHSSAP